MYDADQVSRVDLEYASSLLLFVELLNCLFSQAQTAGISWVDTSAVIALLGLVSGRVSLTILNGFPLKPQ